MRSPLVVIAIAGGAFFVTACQHDDGVASTTTIHSGTPDGARVTDGPDQPEPSVPTVGRAVVRAQLGDKLARAYCSHDRACGLGDAEFLLLSEEACFNDAHRATRASIAEWPCEPAAARAGFDDCVTAIREASCSARRNEGAKIRECQVSEICRRSNIAGQ